MNALLNTLNARPGSREVSLLDRRHMMLLRAALGSGNVAADAFREWRASEPFADVDDTVYRILPLLLETQQRSNIIDADAGRMHGAAKHIWLSNIMRLQQLADAANILRKENIDFMVIKGGALFARQPQFAAKRAAGDYDIQVKRADARRAIQALIGSSFQSLGMRAELFSEQDLDLSIHAIAFAHPKGSGSLDLHWRPIPSISDESYIADLFAHGTELNLFGQTILVPGLADHLFLAVARCNPWETKETFLRAVEITHLLRTEHGNIDWDRFIALVERNGVGGVAAHLLALLRDELDVPMAKDLPERLWQTAGPGKGLELRIRHRPPHRRKPADAYLLSLLKNLRKRAPAQLTWRNLAHLSITRPHAVIGAAYESAIEAPVSDWYHLARLWKWHTRHSPLSKTSTAYVRGFSIPEEQGRWTDGRYAVLVHPVAKGAAPVISVVLTLVPFLPPGTPSFAFEMTGGHDVVQVTLQETSPMPARLTVRCKVDQDAERITIAFKLIDAGIPKQIQHSEDMRMLGVFLQNIEVSTEASGQTAAPLPDVLP